MKNNQQFAHHMLREIYEQPRTVRDNLAGQMNETSGIVMLANFPLSTAELMSLTWLVCAQC